MDDKDQARIRMIMANNMPLRPAYHASMISTMHVHLDSHNCLEVLVVKGKAREIKIIADRLIGTKGVMHGKLTTTTLGKDFR